MHKTVVILLLAVAFAGCVDDAPGEPIEDPTYQVAGRVLTPALNPIADVMVTIVQAGWCGSQDGDRYCLESARSITATTDAQGSFALEGIYAGNHSIRLEHPDYQERTHDVTVPLAENVTIQMTPVNRIVPYQQPLGPFDGYIECALEALIITPSCDTLVAEYGPATFPNDSVWEIDVTDDWATIVLDVDVDLSDHPGVAGLRVSAYGGGADAEVFSYERMAQHWGDGPFTLRIEPGLDYGDNVPAFEGAGSLRFEFFPHGHGDDTVCLPDQTPSDIHPSLQPGVCFLGLGLTQALRFEAIATVFYHEAAPAGWTVHSA